MKADFLEQGRRWVVKGKEKTLTLEAIEMGIAFGDSTVPYLNHHSVAVVGRGEDKVLHILEGHFGFLDDVTKAAVDLKDRFYVKRAWIDRSPDALVMEMRQAEGLSRYSWQQDKLLNRKKYRNPPETWENFRSYDHTCSLIPIPELLEREFTGACVKLESGLSQGKIVSAWREFNRIVRQPLKEIINDSRFRAVVYVVDSLLPRQETATPSRQSPLYKNMPR
jgi:hypothetical protein